MHQVAVNPARRGVIYGILSYAWWGLIPLYFKWVDNIPPVEVLAHRVLWSFIFLALVITLMRRWTELRRVIRLRPVLLTLSASTLLLSLNWFTYIYAVSTNQVVEASIGYFLNPLVNVVIGVAILNEPLRTWQMASVLLAVIGVAILGVPLIAVTLALSFAFYGLLRKQVAVEGLLGLFIETALLLPPATAYIALTMLDGESGSAMSDSSNWLKLMTSGIVTAVPLLLFTAAARRLRFSTLGFLQYLAPTMQFFLAVLVFHEPLSETKAAALGCIWIAVGLYSYDSWRAFQRQRGESARPLPADL